MPAPAVNRVRLNLFGSIGGTADWMTSWYTRPADPVLDQTGINGIATALAAALSTCWSSGLSEFNDPGTNCSAVSAQYYIAGSNAVVLQGGVTGLSHIGTGGEGGAISQCVVVSLKSNLIGRSGRGRMYFPATAALGSGIDAHSFPSGNCNDLRAAVAQMMRTMRDSGGGIAGDLTPVVQSERLGQVHDVTTLRVDARPDRQERREAHTNFYSISGGI